MQNLSVVCFDLSIGQWNLCVLRSRPINAQLRTQIWRNQNKHNKNKQIKSLKRSDDKKSFKRLIYLHRSEVSFFRLFLNLGDDLKESGRHFSPITNVQLNLKYFTTEKIISSQDLKSYLCKITQWGNSSRNKTTCTYDLSYDRLGIKSNYWLQAFIYDKFHLQFFCEINAF